ncbi:MAG: hypothetical protein IKW49_01605 [Opitutales bacterium]|nr:hypothetical protein [Opitutales bacterium]
MSHEDFLQQDSFTIDGVRYVAKDVSLENGCDKCEFKRYRSCPAPHCSPDNRNDGRNIIFVQDEDKKHVDAVITFPEHVYFPDENKHIIQKAIKIVQAYNDWRRGQDEVPGFPTCFTAQELGEAIDTALNFIRRRIE